MDMPFFLLIMVILCIGLVMLFSASYANAYYVYGDSYYFIKDQALFAVLGIVIMIWSPISIIIIFINSPCRF
mgnify:CR=1 FL=1